MAGSYNHTVAEDGRLLQPERLCSMLECMSGDVYEAVEEYYGMVWYLANRLAEAREETTPGPVYAPDMVAEARQHYLQGIGYSPGLNGVLPPEDE